MEFLWNQSRISVESKCGIKVWNQGGIGWNQHGIRAWNQSGIKVESEGGIRIESGWNQGGIGVELEWNRMESVWNQRTHPLDPHLPPPRVPAVTDLSKVRLGRRARMGFISPGQGH